MSVGRGSFHTRIGVGSFRRTYLEKRDTDMRDCTIDSEIMRDEDWRNRFDEHCYFYPMRDCPGWDDGGICGRIGKRIPPDAVPEEG